MEQLIGMVIVAVIFFAVGYFVGNKTEIGKSSGSHSGSADQSKTPKRR